MNVRLFIARRYLFAKKSHNVINVISAISAIGMAIGTAALILILSVYNGFDNLIERNISDLAPDLLMVSPSGSAKFSPDSMLVDALAADKRVRSVRYTLEDNVFLTYGGKQAIARAKGVEDGFESSGKLLPHIVEGECSISKGDSPAAIVGAGLARNLGVHPHFVDMLTMYYPDKNGRISPSNPAASAVSRSLPPAGIVSISTDTDANLVIVPLFVMQELTSSPDNLVSGVEIELKDSGKRAVRKFKRDYSDRCTLLERNEQQRDLFKMMKYEKAAIFLILIFVVLIVALNIYGSLSMLIIEKEDDIATLHALGASGRMVRQIFVLEGWLISLSGLIVGLIAGTALAFAQQKLGFVKMPGNYMVDAYPVVVKPVDIVLTAAAVALIGLVVALVAAKAKEQQR